MKSIVRIFSVIALAAGFVACNEVAEYKTVPFASLDMRSASVKESAEGTVLNIPVHLYNNQGACAVTYAIEDGTAKNGVDFTPVDASGVLNFPAGTDSLAIGVNIKGQPGVFTGNLNFTVALKSADNDVKLGVLKDCTVEIADLDHPLTAIFGDWNMTAVTLASSGYTIAKFVTSLSQYEGNPYRVWISNVIPFTASEYYGAYVKGAKVYAEVSKDLKTITVPMPQDMGASANDAFGVAENYWLYGWNGSAFLTDPATAVFERQDDGSYKSTSDFGSATPTYVGDGLFYYYMNVYGSLSAANPITLVKK